MPHGIGVTTTVEEIRRTVERAGGTLTTRPEMIADALGVAPDNAISSLRSTGMSVRTVADNTSVLCLNLPVAAAIEDPASGSEDDASNVSADEVPDAAPETEAVDDEGFLLDELDLPMRAYRTLMRARK